MQSSTSTALRGCLGFALLLTLGCGNHSAAQADDPPGSEKGAQKQTQGTTAQVMASTWRHAKATDSAPGTIFFASTRDNEGTWEIFKMSPSGDHIQRVVEAAVRRRGEYHPHLSADGRHLSFTTYRYGGWKVATLDLQADPAEVARLTLDPHYAYDASWSPDRRSLAMSRVTTDGAPYFQGQRDIYRLDANGHNVRRLTKTPQATENNPSFSPDGQTVVFDRWQGEQLGLWTVSADGKEETLLIGGAPQSFAPSWSPDGNKVAFLRHHGGDGAADGLLAPWVINADGTHPRPLAVGLPAANDAGFWKLETCWSPDGRHVAWSAPVEGNWDILRVTVDGGDVVRVTDHPGDDLHPSWAPDV